MPFTRRQVKKLLSDGSPLSAAQKAKMRAELHDNPSLGHKKKGSAAMKRGGTESYSYDHRTHRTKDGSGKFHRKS